MLKVYNTLSKKKEDFKPLKGKKVNLFVCGPTVYNLSHIGHARTYISFDVIAKYLKHKGFNVFYLQNITDIDDKIIQRAKEKEVEPKELAKQFEEEYLKDMKALKVDSVTKYARATDHIKKIIDQVKRLLEKRYAYKTRDGIYYDISRFKDYGKLSGRTVLQAEDAVSRVDESQNKKHKGDFALWKKSKPEEPKWESSIGKGRPGWHIEDTAITEKYFGAQYDVHGGARDLIFPHHEAEIAQMEAVSGKSPLVKYWLHSGFLTVKSKKMAKSLDNFITIQDFLKENSPRILRLLVIKNHYRSPINYKESLVKQAKKELDKIDEFTEKLQTSFKPGKNQGLAKKAKENLEKVMDDDFNTPKALAVIFDLTNKGNSLISQNKLSATEAKEILKFLKEIDKVFNFIFWQEVKKETPEEVLKLVKDREKQRKEGKWKEADKTRKVIEKLGYKLEDTKKGPKLKRL